MQPSVQTSRKHYLQQLQQRRTELLARSQQQCQKLIWQAAQIHHELRFVDIGLRIGRSLRAKPIYVAIALAGILIIKPKRALSLAQKGITAWRLWQRFSPYLSPLIQAWQQRSAPSEQNNHDVPSKH
jgi:hypothetical protein